MPKQNNQIDTLKENISPEIVQNLLSAIGIDEGMIKGILSDFIQIKEDIKRLATYNYGLEVCLKQQDLEPALKLIKAQAKIIERLQEIADKIPQVG